MIAVSGTAQRLAALRIGLCGVLALRLMRGIYLDLTQQPAALYQPLSFMKLLDSMPPRSVVLAIQVAGVCAAIVAAIGWRARITLPIAWTCGVLLGGMTTSIGKVVHNDVLLLLAMVPLLIAPVADAWAVDARGRNPAPGIRYGWPVRVAMIVVAGAYFFTGWQKIVTSGPSWVTSGNLRWVLYASSDGQPSPNMWALMLAGQAWLCAIVAGFTILTETLFPLVLWKERLAWIFVPAAVAMHIGILLAMRLDYTAQIATIVIVFVNWPAVIARVRARRIATVGA